MPRHIGIVGVSVEGALLCASRIQAGAERLPEAARPDVSLHFQPFVRYSKAAANTDWPVVGELLLASIGALRRAGADFAIIAANAPHFAIEHVAPRSPLPILNLVEAVADECRRRGLRTVGVLGVRWTMRGGLYTRPMAERGIRVLVPDEAEQEALHEIITKELFELRVRPESTRRLVAIVERLRGAGCEGVALACTELPLALNDEVCGCPALDTTRILADAALARSQE